MTKRIQNLRRVILGEQQSGAEPMGREEDRIPSSWVQPEVFQKYFHSAKTEESVKRLLDLESAAHRDLAEIMRRTDAFWQEFDERMKSAPLRDRVTREEFILKFQQGGLPNSYARFVVKAKRLWLDLLSGPGAKISLQSFGAEGMKDFGKAISVLNQFQRLNSREVDRLIEETIVEAHAERRKVAVRNHGQPLSAVIQGGGPTGLFSIFKLYMEGADVTLAHDRAAAFERSQIIRFDPIWQAQLQYYLGEKYQRILDRGIGVIRTERNAQTGQSSRMLEIPLHIIEDAFYERAREVQKRAQYRAQNDPTTSVGEIKMHFSTRVEEVLAPSKEDPNHFRVRVRERGADQPREIKSDVLVLAGGSRNPLRDQILSPAYEQTDPLTHSVSVFRKGGTIQRKALKTAQAEIDTLFDGRLPMRDLAEAWRRLPGGLDGWINEHLQELGLESRSQFDNFSDLLVAEEEKVVRRAGQGVKQGDIKGQAGFPSVTIRQFENSESVYLGYKVPAAVAKLRRAILEAQLAAPEGSRQRFTNFLDSLEERFHTAAMSALVTPEALPHLTRDPSPVANGFFEVVQSKGERTTAVHHSGNASLIAFGAGDAITSPHFMTWSGLNMARVSVEAAAGSVRALVDTPLKALGSAGHPERRQKAIEEIASRLQDQHSRQSRFLLTRGQWFLTPLEPKELTEKKGNKQRQLVEDLVSKQAGIDPQEGEIRIKKADRGVDRYIAMVGYSGGQVREVEFTLGTHEGMPDGTFRVVKKGQISAEPHYSLTSLALEETKEGSQSRPTRTRVEPVRAFADSPVQPHAPIGLAALQGHPEPSHKKGRSSRIRRLTGLFPTIFGISSHTEAQGRTPTKGVEPPKAKKAETPTRRLGSFFRR